MISVVHRYARALSHISPGISAQVTRDDAQARRYVHASANHMASKRMHKAGPALRKRDKHPSRVRGSNGQDSLTERIHRAYNNNVPAIYRRLDASNELNTDLRMDQTKPAKKRELETMQQECHALLLKYQQKLYHGCLMQDPQSDGLSSDGDTHESIQMLVDAIDFQKQQQAIPAQNLQESEELFKNICSKLQILTRSSGSLNSTLAEAFLLSLVRLRTGRATMMRQIAQDSHRQDVSKSWGSWISDVFLVSPGDDDTDTVQPSTSHSDTNYGPDVSLFELVLASIINEALQKCEISSVENDVRQQVYLETGERMTQLIEIIPSTGFQISPRLLCQVLFIYDIAGSLIAARKAEHFYKQYCKSASTWLPAKTTLRVYRTAMNNDNSQESHATLVEMASNLVMTSATKPAESYSRKINLFAFALYCLRVSTTTFEKHVDLCLLADEMVKKCVGMKEFRGFFQIDQIRPEPKYARLVHNLLFVYAMSPHEARLEQAISLLAYLEVAGERFTPQVLRPSQPPFFDTYMVLLTAIEKARRLDDTIASNKINNHRVTFAVTLLDRMIGEGLWPSNNIFDILFRICHRDGEKTEMILRRMELREVFDSNLRVSRNHYHGAISAWEFSAKCHVPGAAERAEKLVRKMEVQSGVSIGHVLSDVLANVPLQKRYAMMYNRNLVPDESIYCAFLRTCSSVRIQKEKQQTFEMAFNTLHRMEALGIALSEDVFICAMWSCKNLLDDPGRKVEEGTRIFDLAQKNGKISMDLVATFRELSNNQEIGTSPDDILVRTQHRLDGESGNQSESKGNCREPAISPPVLTIC